MKRQFKSLIAFMIVTMLLIMQLPTMVLANVAGEIIHNFTKSNNKERTEYKEGYAIIMYKKSNYSSKSNSILSELKIEDSVEFTNANTTKGAKSTNASKEDIVVSLVSTDKYSTDDLIKKLKKDNRIMHVSKNYTVKASSITNEPYEKYQWAIENNGQNNGEEDFDINPIESSDTEKKVIAIIDTGVDYNHEDLNGVMWENPYESNKLAGKYGYNFAYDNTNPMDDNGHGTHCAGIIASNANNEKGITGAVLGAENVQIMALKFLDEEGYGDNYSAIAAYNYIYRAQQLGTNVVAVNNSWGGYAEETDEVLTEVINMVGKNGALSICAAGNDGTYISDYPDDWDFVSPACLGSEYIVTVGASNEKDELATFSNYGYNVDIAAPGTNILSTVSYNSFNPTIYTEEQKEDLCSTYYDFEDGLKGFEYKASTGSEVTTSYEAFGDAETKSLNWNIYDADPDTTYNLAIKIDIEDSEQYYSMMLNTSCNSDVGGYYVLRPSGAFFDEIEIDDIELPSDSEEYIYEENIFNYQNYWEHLNGEIGDYVKYTGGAILLQFKPDDTGNYSFNIDDFAISKIITEENKEDLGKYDFYNGTSMATPFVTAAVATTSNLYKGETALQTKSRILSGARYSDSFSNNDLWTEGTLDLTDLENVDPEITSVSIDNNGKIEIKGAFFGNNPTLYINLNYEDDESQDEEVNAEYDKEKSTFTFTNKDLKNKYVRFKVVTEEQDIWGEPRSCTSYEFLKTGIEFNIEKFDLGETYYLSLVTDGEKIYYNRNDDELIVLDPVTGDKKVLATADIYNLFESYNDTMLGSYIEFGELVYANNKIWSIATFNCSYAEERILVYYELNKEDAKWEKACSMPEYITERYNTFTTYNSDLYLIGGISNPRTEEEELSKNVYIYDTVNNTWKDGTDLPVGRCTSEAVQVGNKLILMFGGQENGKIPNTLIFDGKEWKESNSYEFLNTKINEGFNWGVSEYAAWNYAISPIKDGVIITGISGEGFGETLKYNVDNDSYEPMEYIVKNGNAYYVEYTISVKNKLYVAIYDYEKDKMELKSLPIESGMVEVKTNIINNGATIVDSNNKEITGTKTYLPGTKIELTINAKNGYYLNGIKVNGKEIEGNKYNAILTSNTSIEVNTGKYVSNIKLDKTLAELEVGKTLNLVATVDSEATNKNITWKSSNENIAIVSNDGKVTAKSEGEAIITVMSKDGSNIAAQCKIKVFKPAPVIPDKTKISISNCSVTGIEQKTYTGQPLTQVLTIKNGSKVLNEGIDYSLDYSNNNLPGRATIIITGIGDYEGTITKTFIIKPKKVTGLKVKEQKTDSIKLSWSAHTGITKYKIYSYNYSKNKWEYIGKTDKTTYTIKKLKPGTTYKYRVRAYKTVDGTQYFGSYTSSLKTTTKTKKPSISKLTTKSKKATIKWKKVSGASGYQIYMATSKNGKYSKIKTITKGKTVSYTKSKLKKNKKYYFKIRAYRTIDGKKVYSSYSSVKNIKVK